MSSLSPSDLIRASQSPVLASGGLRTLDVSTTDASIELAAGTYEVLSGASAHAVASLTGSATSLPPSTGAAEATGAFMVPAGGAVTVAIDTATTLHAKLLSGTGTLYLHRKAVL